MLAKARGQQAPKRYNGAPCAYFDGIFDYFNINEVAYHAKVVGGKWNGPCVLFYFILRLKISIILLILQVPWHLIEFFYLDSVKRNIKWYFTMVIGTQLYPIMIQSKE